VGLFGVFGDAARLYVLLWRHSLPAAALAISAVWAAGVALERVESTLSVFVVGIAALIVGLSAPMLVQGMLIVLVEDVHEGRRATETRVIAMRALHSLPSLVGASIVYFFGVLFGLLLLIVPGLIAASRWCLMPPLIVLERRDIGEARARSSGIVSGKTGRVLLIVIVLGALEYGLPTVASDRDLVLYGLTALVTPYVAHALSALYYRLTEPERPVISARHGSLGSAWDEHALEDARRASS
jgi:hypothetical protein